MPFANEHACRIKDPGGYDDFRRTNCAQKHDGKCIDVIYGIKDKKSEIQALRYPKKTWTKADARKHCKSRNGTFEAAAEDSMEPITDNNPIVDPEDIENEIGNQKKTFTAWFKQEGEHYSIWANTADIDRDKEIILPSAYRKHLRSYLHRNPVILAFHDYWSFSIGKAVKGRIKAAEGLMLDIEFAETPEGATAEYLYKNGFMNSFSVGFIPHGHISEPDAMKEALEEAGIPVPKEMPWRIFTEVELLEVSAVPVPANEAANMIREIKSKGVHLPELNKLLTESMRSKSSMPEGGKSEKRNEVNRIKIRGRSTWTPESNLSKKKSGCSSSLFKRLLKRAKKNSGS